MHLAKGDCAEFRRRTVILVNHKVNFQNSGSKNKEKRLGITNVLDEYMSLTLV